MKLAAMEGLYDGSHGQEIVAFGILNHDKQPGDNAEPYLFDISIPYGLSILASHNADAFVPGVNDLIKGISFTPEGDTINTVSYAERIARGKAAQQSLEKYHEAKQTGDTAAMAIHAEAMKADFDYFGYGYLSSPEEAIPNIPLTFYTFHAMVILGGYLLIFLIASLLLAYKRGIMEKVRWASLFQRLAIITIPLVYLCSICGWVVAEVGRQPWTIQDLMPNCVAISDISAGYVQTTFAIFAVIFTALLAADICIITKQISKKSKENLDTAK
jgi:cytochrome d ubiquinol oxidase subunit I